MTIVPAPSTTSPSPLASPQTDGVAFTGINTLTAQDLGSNTITGFNASTNNVTITAISPLTGTVSFTAGHRQRAQPGGDFPAAWPT